MKSNIRFPSHILVIIASTLVDSNLVCLQIQGFDSDDLAAGYFVNHLVDETNPIGKLMLFDDNFNVVEIMDEFELEKFTFLSLFVVKNNIFVLKQDPSNNRFFLLKYSDVY